VKPRRRRTDRLADVHASPGHLLRRAQQIAVALFFEEARAFAITPVQYAALTAIAEYPGLDQSGLVDAIAIDRSTVGSLVHRLEERRLIRRTTPATNRRIKQLFITAQGTKLLEGCRGAVTAAQARILAALNVKERAEFMQLLGKLVHLNNDASRVPLKISET
jgi:DNA-binding MarR family transcriptional regulator